MEIINLSKEKCEHYLEDKPIDKAVLFPDAFLKDKYKHLDYDIAVPSSSVIVSDSLAPQLRSRGLYCSISLLRLNVENRPKNITKIYDIFKKIPQLKTSKLLYRLCPLKHKKYDLSFFEYIKVLKEGPEYLIKKHRIEDPVIERVFRKEHISFKKTPLTCLIGRPYLKNDFGKSFAGNHFIELQEVNKIYDRQISNSNSLNKGDLLITYHTSGLSLEIFLQRKYVKKYLKNKKVEAIKDRATVDRVLNALNIVRNYSLAYTLNFYVILRDLFEKEFKRKNIVEFILYAPHNMISKKGDNYLYHHNAISLKNKLNFIAGNYNFDSLIVAKGDNSERFIDSADHGIARFVSLNESDLTGDKIKRILVKNGKITETSIKKYSEQVLNDYIDLMTSKGIIKPICSLSPIINYKEIK